MRVWRVRCRPIVISGAALVGAATAAARATALQPLDERIDRDAFISGLAEYGLDDLLDAYLDEIGGDLGTVRLAEVARARGAYRSASTRGEAEVALHRLLDAHRALLDAESTDPEYPIRQADLAFDLLFIALRHDGLDVELEFGVPRAGDIDRASAWAAEAWRLADDALIGVSDLILDLEEDPEFASDAALQQRRRRLVSEEQGRRLPFLFEVARYWDAVLNSAPDERRERLLATASSLDAMLADLDEPWRSEARLFATLARGHASESAPLDDGGSWSRPLNRLRGALLEVDRAAADGGSQAALARLDQLALQSWITNDPFAALIVADQEVRQRLGQRIGVWRFDGDWDRLVSAATAYDEFIEDPAIELPREAREALVMDRLARLTPADAPPESLPPMLVVAQADRLLREGADALVAVDRLRALLARASTGAPERDASAYARALRLLAGEALRVDDRREAAELLLRLASDFPTHAAAPDAARSAASIARSLYHDERDSETTDLYRRALTELTDRYSAVESIDEWLYERARLLLDESRPDEAGKIFARVSPSARLHADAQYQIARLAYESAGAAPDRYEDALERVDAALRAVRGSVTNASADEDRARDLRYYEAALQVMRAGALLELERIDEALETVDTVTNDPDLPSALVADAVSLRVRIQRARGQSDALLDDLRALADRSPERAAPAMLDIAREWRDRARDQWIAENEDEAQRLANDRVVPVARLALDTLERMTTRPDPSLATNGRLYLADGLLLAARPAEAAPHYRAILTDRPNSAEAALGLADSLYGAGDRAEAIRWYKRVALGLRENRSWMYWHAELRALQILDEEGRNTDQIYPYIQRLRRVDDDLGGERFARSFRALEIRHEP
ncbi:MAG: tetratricopeptide repeat protein [Phycisphaerales bacterium]